VFFPKPLLGGHEFLAFGRSEFAASKRHVPPHQGLIHELDNGRLVDISEPREHYRRPIASHKES
jgi:hypothetical protein